MNNPNNVNKGESKANNNQENPINNDQNGKRTQVNENEQNDSGNSLQEAVDLPTNCSDFCINLNYLYIKEESINTTDKESSKPVTTFKK